MGSFATKQQHLILDISTISSDIGDPYRTYTYVTLLDTCFPKVFPPKGNAVREITAFEDSEEIHKYDNKLYDAKCFMIVFQGALEIYVCK